MISENEVRRLLFLECILHTRTFSPQFDLVLSISPVGDNHCHKQETQIWEREILSLCLSCGHIQGQLVILFILTALILWILDLPLSWVKKVILTLSGLTVDLSEVYLDPTSSFQNFLESSPTSWSRDTWFYNFYFILPGRTQSQPLKGPLGNVFSPSLSWWDKACTISPLPPLI